MKGIFWILTQDALEKAEIDEIMLSFMQLRTLQPIFGIDIDGVEDLKCQLLSVKKWRA